MHEITQLIVLGILLGGMYGLLAAGSALITGVMNVLNFAQGDFVTIPALCVWAIWSATKINPFLILIPVALGTLLVGAGVQRVLIERVVGRPFAMGLLLTFGLSLLMESNGGFAFGFSYREIPVLTSSFTVAGITLPEAQLVTFGGAVAVYLVIVVLLHRTQFGRALRACTQNPEAAVACGINARSVRTWAFGIGTMLAALAGGFLIQYFPINPISGFQIVLVGLIAQMIGGVTWFEGAFLGGLVLGEIDLIGGYYTTAEWAQIMVYGSLLVLFLFRGTVGARDQLR